MKQLVIFASGAGSNASKIIDYFRDTSLARVALICCNKQQAGVLTIAEKENIPVLMLERERFFYGDAYIGQIREFQPDLIILAGFLWKLPPSLVQAFPQKIVNIHPALLPAYGGKGMYGNRVHQAVLDAGEKSSGISIHYVDEHFDNGDLIFQAQCSVLPNDTAETLAARIHELEHRHFPEEIEKLLQLQKAR